MNYDFLNGQEMNGNVAELWTAKNGKLQSLPICFDTLTFANNNTMHFKASLNYYREYFFIEFDLFNHKHCSTAKRNFHWLFKSPFAFN
jgi:Holliday junction resolvase-like predicted endonuclease